MGSYICRGTLQTSPLYASHECNASKPQSHIHAVRIEKSMIPGVDVILGDWLGVCLH